MRIVILIPFVFLTFANGVRSNDVGVCALVSKGEDVNGLLANVPGDGTEAGDYFTVKEDDSNLNDCVDKCCKQDTCHVAFLFGGHKCYLIACKSRHSCRPVPSDQQKHSASRFVWVRYPPVSNETTTVGSVLPLDDDHDEEENDHTDSTNVSTYVGIDEECGGELGLLCGDGLVCKAQKDSQTRCSCRAGAAYDNDKRECVEIAPEQTSGAPWKGPTPCTMGLRECGENEQCFVDAEREKSKRGSCVCIKGLTRNTVTGKCEDKVTTTLPPAKQKLEVVIVGDSTIQLPVPFVELSASVSKNVSDELSFIWSVKESPVVEGKESSPYSSQWAEPMLKLSKLVPGKYTFHVAVSGKEHEGVGDFSLNVKAEPKENRPPVAILEPSFIRAVEGNKIILDGSQSNDPDGEADIASYKWEIEKGPSLTGTFEPANSPTMQFEKGLPAGNYTFSLTVTDKAGSSAKATVAVAITKERDDPPKAVAGSCAVGAATGDFSVTLKSDQKVNSFLICGNNSKDDKEIVKWLWTRVGKMDLPADTQGSNTPVLKVTNIGPGMYEFSLKVEDAKGQKDETTLNVHVAPDQNAPPTAIAKLGDDKPLVLSDPNQKLAVVLDGTASSDDGTIVLWAWSQLSGPEAKLLNEDKQQATASELTEGKYVFQLNVTDDKKASAQTQISFDVTRSSNKPPEACADSIRVELPLSEAVLDGSKSKDDAGVTSYEWRLLDSSPAYITILGESYKEQKLRVGNLVPGSYNFSLSVQDAAHLKSTTYVSLEVALSKREAESVELYLDLEGFTGSSKERLEQLLGALFTAETTGKKIEVHTTDVAMDYGSGRTRVVFHAIEVKPSADGSGSETDQQKLSVLSGAACVDLIQRKLSMLKEFNIVSFDTLYCRQGACSGHGTCNNFTKHCECNRFWMPNIFAVFIMGRKNRCEWSVFYFLILSLLAVSTVAATLWTMFCVGRRCSKKPSARRRKYKLLDDSPHSNHRGIGFKKVKGKNGVQMSSLLVSDSAGSDTDDDDTLFDSSMKRNGSFTRMKASKA